jgi:hypothetical protein
MRLFLESNGPFEPSVAGVVPSPVGYSIRMTRRRLVLAVFVAVVAVGAAWWLSAGLPSSDERRLLGTWRLSRNLDRAQHVKFTADFHMRSWNDAGSDQNALWRIRDGKLIADCETNPLRRLARPVASFVPINIRPVEAYALVSVTADEFVIEDSDGERYMLTRDRGD